MKSDQQTHHKSNETIILCSYDKPNFTKFVLGWHGECVTYKKWFLMFIIVFFQCLSHLVLIGCC